LGRLVSILGGLVSVAILRGLVSVAILRGLVSSSGGLVSVAGLVSSSSGLVSSSSGSGLGCLVIFLVDFGGGFLELSKQLFGFHFL
jgi:hypothetical protein